MKRFFAIIGVIFATVSSFGNIFGKFATFHLGILCLIVLLGRTIFRFKSKNQNLSVNIWLLAGCFCCMYFVSYCIVAVAPIEKYCEQNVELTGYVTLCEKTKNGDFSYKILVNSIDGNSISTKVFVVSPNKQCEVGDNVKFKAKIKKPNENVRSFLYGENVYCHAQTEQIKITETNHKTLAYGCFQIQKYVTNIIDNSFDSNVGMCVKGILMGDKSALTEKAKSDLTVCGVLHLMTVSGMHIGIISRTVNGFFLKLGISKTKSAFLSLFPTMLLVLLSGFSPSAIRATIIYIIAFGGMIIFKQPDIVNSIGIAAVIMLMYNPFYICNVSFLLSFLSLLAIVVLTPKIKSVAYRSLSLNENFRKISNHIVSVFCQSIVVGFITMPIMVVYFGRVSLISPIANVLVCFIAMLSLIFAIVVVMILALGEFDFLAFPFVVLVNMAMKYILFVVGKCAKIPVSSVQVSPKEYEIFIGLLLITACGILIIKMTFFEKRLKQKLGSVSCCNS